MLLGCYDLPGYALTCVSCNKHWALEVSGYGKSGYWFVAMQAQTLFHQDLFHCFEAMKTVAAGMSAQAFTAMLEQKIKRCGRVTKNVAER